MTTVRYLDPLERLQYEIIQRREEGRDEPNLDEALSALQAEPIDSARDSAYKLLAELMAKDSTSQTTLVHEPDDLTAIRRAAGNSASNHKTPYAGSDNETADRLLGGWLGRAAGCLLGKPVERYPRPVLRQMLQSNNNWPLTNYWTQRGMPQAILQQYPWKSRGGWQSLRENIQSMPEDDDLNYVMLNLYIMETYGRDFSSADVGQAWLSKMPAYQTFTAERVAYFNLLEGREPPYCATFINPFREWIGAQIRADLWGYVSPGNPSRATELAWRDARLSHTGNGIYGEMFFSALIANAFVESDLRRLVESALGFIPAKSRFANAIRLVLDLPINTLEWEAVVDIVYANFGHYHWVHSINNAALTVAALLAGDGDYERTICNTVMGGWDTDSNGATAGSIIGVIQGADSLPEKWIAPLNNRIASSIGGFDNARFTDLAQRTLKASRHSASRPSGKPLSLSNDF